HPLVELPRLDRAVLPGPAEMRLERDRVESHEPVYDLPHLPGGAEDPHVGTAVRDDLEIAERRPRDGAHDGHRLAPAPPPTDADAHPVAELRHHVGFRDAFVGHAAQASGSSASPNVSRTSAATPLTFSSNVNPCSNR